LYAAHPDLTTEEVARRMQVRHSKARKLLSSAYAGLGVRCL
jgi:hypothetical protein